MRASVRRWLAVVTMVQTLLFAGSALGHAEGIDSRFTFPPLGCGSEDGGAAGLCHVQVENPELIVTIDGPTEITEGFGLYTVSIPAGFQNLDGAGMNVAIAAGNSTGCTLEEGSPPSTMADRDETLADDGFVLSHDYTGPESTPTTLDGIWSYQFLLVNCTNPGPLLLLAAMNAFDGDGTEEGEVWNKTQLDVTVPEPTAALLGATALAVLAALCRTRA